MQEVYQDFLKNHARGCFIAFKESALIITATP
jgi:hypothetical protein